MRVGQTIVYFFSIDVLKNGKISGDLSFPNCDPTLLKFCNQMKPFTLEGKDDNDTNIVVENGVMTTVVEEAASTGYSISSKFDARKVLLCPESQVTKPNGDILIHFGLLNVYQTFGVRVETNLGTLEIMSYNYATNGNKGHNHPIELEKLMNSYGLSFVTSLLKISVKANGSKTLEQIVNTAKLIVQNFLKITSLSQVTWHDWVFLVVYDKVENNPNTAQPIFSEFDSPKVKVPALLRVAPLAYSNDFINAAWKGYSDKLEKMYAFDSALEWLVESNVTTLFETRFINATTCLEMLMDRFHSQNNTEFLLDEKTFKEFFCAIRKTASEFLKSRGVRQEIRNALYNSLRGSRRRSYKDKAIILLDHWGITYSDTGITIDDIKDIRNAITHTGRYHASNQEEFSNAIRVYHGIMTILIRIFLAMLDYHEYYHDPWQDRWIRFRDLCSKIASP